MDQADVAVVDASSEPSPVTPVAGKYGDDIEVRDLSGAEIAGHAGSNNHNVDMCATDKETYHEGSSQNIHGQ